MNKGKKKIKWEELNLEELKKSSLSYLLLHFMCMAFLLVSILGEKKMGLDFRLIIGAITILTWYIFLKHFQKYLALKKS